VAQVEKGKNEIIGYDVFFAGSAIDRNITKKMSRERAVLKMSVDGKQACNSGGVGGSLLEVRVEERETVPIGFFLSWSHRRS